MLNRLRWPGRMPSAARAAWRLEPGQRVYAVGDVHGRFDLLERMIGTVEADLEAHPASGRTVLVFVGDYVDRGPAAREVIGYLHALAIDGVEVVCLCGNHEQVMLDFLSDASRGPQWCSYGGDTTLASYGVALPRLRSQRAGWEEVRERLNAALPAAHVAFLRSLPTHYVVGTYLFVHAGVDPDKAFARQDTADFLWQREPFLNDRRTLEHCVVHGHTPAPEPYRDHRRIGIDTGAYVSGVLSAVRLEGEEARFMQV